MKIKGYEPYKEGRWYRFFIESTGTSSTLVEKDIEEAIINVDAIILPSCYVIMDLVYDIHATGGNAETASFGYHVIDTDGRHGATLPVADSYDSGYIYIFAKTV